MSPKSTISLLFCLATDWCGTWFVLVCQRVLFLSTGAMLGFRGVVAR